MLFDVAVLGAGAAGMMCAAVAGQGLRVVLVDHAERLAEKIRISGGAAAISPISAPAPPTSCPRTRTSAVRRWRATRRRISWRCSSAIACPGTRSIAASCSATIPANPSSGCCARVRRRPGGLAHGLFGGRDRPRRAGLRAAHQPGPHPCGQAGRGDRRHGDPAAGRHRFRPEDRAPVRPENRRATARAGAADLRRGAVAAVVGAVRRGAGSEPVHGAGQGARRIPRRPAVHASRAVGAGDFADFQLLEAGRAHRGGPGAGP